MVLPEAIAFCTISVVALYPSCGVKAVAMAGER